MESCVVMVSGARRIFLIVSVGLGYGDGDDGAQTMFASLGIFRIGAEWW